ncbi:MAG: flavin reductase family protein [Planctomycetota bacterium]|jgi:flavin reductase (DIM6/NTAB) family NADH-FMN oxidoreductase RutF
MQIEVPFEQVTARLLPEPVAIAVARDSRGRDNPITLGWVMRTSIEPPMLAISVGLARHSLDVIRGAGAFVVAWPSAALAEDVTYFGTHSGREVDKLAVRGTATQPASRAGTVLLAEAVANVECDLVGEMTTGDHVLLVGRVVAAHVSGDAAAQRVFTVSWDGPPRPVTPA